MGNETDENMPENKRYVAKSKRIEIVGLELCLERGIENVTVEEIAKAAGISRRTFYRYFSTVDELLTAMWERSLHYVSGEMRKRPASESIGEAWVFVTRHAKRTGEELRINRLALQIAQKSPAAWWQAASGLRTKANAVYGAIVADRLRASGHDPKAAPAVTAAILAILGQLSRQKSGMMKWVGPDPDVFDAALRSVGEILNDPPAVPAD